MSSTSMPWIKLYTEMLDDPKIGRLDDVLKWRFTQLCLYVGELDNDGYLPADLNDAAWRLRLDVEQLKKDLFALKDATLTHLDEDTGCWCITKFTERQGRSQAEKREQWRKRQQKKRQGDNGVSHAGVTGDNNVTHASREEEDKEEEERRDAAPPPPEDWDWIPDTPKDAEQHPAIRLYIDVTDRFPGQKNWEPVIETLKYLRGRYPRDADLIEFLTPHWMAWKTGRRKTDGKPYDKNNIAWLTERALAEVKSRNGPPETIPLRDALNPDGSIYV